jgi:hypothetical protein
VSQTFASWNRIRECLRRLDALRRVAWRYFRIAQPEFLRRCVWTDSLLGPREGGGKRPPRFVVGHRYSMKERQFDTTHRRGCLGIATLDQSGV